ncbi:hypothetical protein L208DRAFT_1281647, partial [Tricholoma matsutake]
IYSLLQQGAPFWFITLLPADSKHLLTLYFAGKLVTFCPTSLTNDDHCFGPSYVRSFTTLAAFFSFHLIIPKQEHILGVGSKHPGLFGETSAYYGSIEQQGCLTLHLHLLLWIKGSLSPDKTWKRILDPTSEFCQKLIDYLEKAHIGEFMTGSCDHCSHRT